MNKRVPARDLRRLQHNRISIGSAYRTTSFDRIASPIGCFQPGTFFRGHAHAKALSKVTADGKYLPSTRDRGVTEAGTKKARNRVNRLDIGQLSALKSR